MPRGLVVLLGAAAATVIVAGLRAVAWLAGPVLLALVIVIVLSPVHGWLRRRGAPAWVATGVLLVAVYGLLVGFVLVVLVSLAQLGAVLPEYADEAAAMLADLTRQLSRLGLSPEQLRLLAASVDPGKLAALLLRLVGDLTGLTTSLVFLLALLLFLSAEAGYADARLRELSPRVREVLAGFGVKTRRYLVVTTVFGLIIAVLDAIVLLWMGIPLALLWGLLSFVTNYIPNIGFLMGVLPPAVLGLLTSGPRGLLVVVVLYVLINFVVQSLIQPRFVGDAVGLSPAVTLVALVFWTWVLGPLGMVLAVPATSLAVALLVELDPRAGWATALMRAR
ncbi:putative PurR-regulated permease PerM [Crossiella equi]|uniref:PurR-regulated permease PerM n=1 Tax=Crossiella equi TaxID=130796 RepID=A0ABS5ARW8_9PSEU|nr:AI-2E family transporter [Crossiella equi]MBP2479324.1 putative PurR-regulated permease PerM [Crossiella equi]